MSEDGRVIKPISSPPAPTEEILDKATSEDMNLDAGIASSLLGFRQAHLRKIIRKILGKDRPPFISFAELAEIYVHTRGRETILCDSNFTTQEGREGLINLIQDLKLEKEGKKPEIEKDSIFHGQLFNCLTQISDESVNAVITSPPYWGTRIYLDEYNIKWADGAECPFGWESIPEGYIRHTLEIFLRLRRILNKRGTIWWNLGDVFNTRTQIREKTLERLDAMREGEDITWRERRAKRHSAGHEYLKDKDLCLIPHRVAIGLERMGFWVRSWITWQKENVIPEPTKDRPTVGHENILLISKSKAYDFYKGGWKNKDVSLGTKKKSEFENLRTVWTFPASSGKGNHGATFPIELPARCVLLSTRKGDLVFDPFMGSGSTAVAAKKLGRHFIGCEVSKEYISEAEKNLKQAKKP